MEAPQYVYVQHGFPESMLTRSALVMGEQAHDAWKKRGDAEPISNHNGSMPFQHQRQQQQEPQRQSQSDNGNPYHIHDHVSLARPQVQLQQQQHQAREMDRVLSHELHGQRQQQHQAQHGSYDISVISARSMEPLAFASSYGSQPAYTLPCGVTGYFPELSHRGSGASSGKESLEILNAESYDDGTGRSRVQEESEVRRRVQDAGLPFGMNDRERVERDSGEEVLVLDSNGIPDEGEKVNEPGKKRKRKQKTLDALSGDDEADAGKRARGRPRVDTKDETPTERRRTQIRLAQRAYRNRKESTITSLEKTVQDLKSSNQEMSQMFAKLFEFAANQGVLQREPELARQLQNATALYATASRLTPAETTNSDGTITSEGKQESEGTTSDHGSNVKIMAKIQQHERNTPLFGTANPWGGYIVSNDDTSSRVQHDQQLFPGISDDSDAMQVITRPTEDNASFPIDFAELQQFEAEFGPDQNFAQSFMQPNPPAPSTLAHGEISFARRLHRTTTEMALKLASMRNPPPSKWNRVFGICSQFETKDMIIARLKRVLATTSKETMQQWREPFVHLGGAGMHYPVRGEDTTIMPQFQTGYSMGPFAEPVTRFQDKNQDCMTLKNLPVNEIYFDSNDIESYLRNLGISITSTADFVHAEIDLVKLNEGCQDAPRGGSGNTITTLSTRSPPQLIGTPAHHSAHMHKHNLSFGTSDLLSVSVGSGHQGSGNNPPELASSNSTAFDQYSAQTAVPAPRDVGTNPSSSLTLVTINVEKFVAELISHCICLGRAPGFRPVHVNQALMTAIRATGIPT